MPDPRRIARQWLETDAAFGVTEVPLPQHRPAAPGLPTNTAKTAGDNAPRAVTPASHVPSPAPQPPPGVSPAETNTRFAVRRRDEPVPETAGDPMPSVKKTTLALPPTPAGRIADLPPITRQQKIAALAELQAAAERDLGGYLTDISTKVVFGEGDAEAPLMFVGEGPGIEEDRTGRPFVGKSGQLLDRQIAAMGFQRAQVFIANIVKLRAAGWDETEGRVKDRPPTPEEVARQIWILHEQIAAIRPTAIVTLGAPAVKWLMGMTEGISKVRGTWLDYRGIPLLPTYHPAFLLRAYTIDNRRKVWEDLQKVMALLGKKPGEQGRS